MFWEWALKLGRTAIYEAFAEGEGICENLFEISNKEIIYLIDLFWKEVRRNGGMSVWSMLSAEMLPLI